MDYLALGQRVRRQRKALGLTQEELSERANISISFLGHIERGTRKASVETLVNLANALEISSDALLQESLDPKVFLAGGGNSQALVRELNRVLQSYELSCAHRQKDGKNKG